VPYQVGFGVRMRSDLLDAVDAFAKEHRIKRDAAISKLVRAGLGRRVQLHPPAARDTAVTRAADRAENRVPKPHEKWR
jgi:metal-responsive CopG/Arc/MetJ family transcriptional regulator